jgi:hypothetical protein
MGCFSGGTASSSCERARAISAKELSKPIRAIDLLGKLEDLPLDARSKELVLANPELRLLAEETHQGEGITFAFEGMGGEKFKGEYIQSRYVESILRLVFPQAKVVRGGSPSGPGVIKLRFIDSAETGNEVDATGNIIGFRSPSVESTRRWNEQHGIHYLEMSILKPANPNYSSVSRPAARQALGIAPDARVISLYLSDFKLDQDQGEGLRSIWRSLSPATHPNVVIVSLNSETHDVGSLQSWMLAHPDDPFTKSFDRVITLSSLPPGGLSSFHSERVLVINDTTGKMPFLNATANLAVVSGPISQFEGLAVGTPTLGYSPDALMNGYRTETFGRSISQAQATGGYQRVTDSIALGQAAQALLANTGSITPPFLTTTSEGTPFSIMLGHLANTLRKCGLGLKSDSAH